MADDDLCRVFNSQQQNHCLPDRATPLHLHWTLLVFNKRHIYREVLCIARTLLSQAVCPSDAGTVWKRLNISSNFFSPSGSHTVLVIHCQKFRQYTDVDSQIGEVSNAVCVLSDVTSGVYGPGISATRWHRSACKKYVALLSIFATSSVTNAIPLMRSLATHEWTNKQWFIKPQLAIARLWLHASMTSICLPVCLFVCLSLCLSPKYKINAIFLKTKQFRATWLSTTYRKLCKLNWASKKNPLLDPYNPIVGIVGIQ